MSRAGGYVGKGIPPRDAARFTTGDGRYVNDLRFPDLAHVAFVRSTEAHARISHVDISAARAHPEAIAVLTAQELEPLIVGRYWGGWEGTSVADGFPLARGKVRWVGEPVAVVVASSRYVAEDIAELVEVDYEPLGAVVDPEVSLEGKGDLLYDDWGNNLYYHVEFEGGDVEGAFANAAGVIKRRFSSQRHTGTPLETRGIVAQYDRAAGSLRVHANWQDVFLARTVVARILGLPQPKLHITAPDSGGGFGVKLPVYPEELACCCVAMLVARPVKWVQDRREDLLGTTQHRDMIVDLELAHDDEARVLGLKAKILSDAGAYGIPARGNAVEGMMAAEDMYGAYDVPAYAYELDVVLTNKAPTSVYRGVALPMTIAFMDRMMDELALATGFDRREVRVRNLFKEFPAHTVTGYEYEPGSYVETLERALELIDFDGFPEYQRLMRDQGRYVGLGIGTGCEAVARGAAWYGVRGVPISGQEGCQIKIDPDGHVLALLGTTTQGQGIETVLAQIIADELDVELSSVTVSMGDTALSPYGAGSWASRQATLGGTAAFRAAQKMREKLLQIAGVLLEADPGDLELVAGSAQVKGNAAVSISIPQIAHAAYFTASELPPEIEPTLEETAHFDPPAATWSNATHAVILEVDPVTCGIQFHKYVVVHDAGRIINPLIVEGQIYGGTAQGIGGTIYEHVIHDENGQPLATTFMDYLVPTVHEVPRLEIEHFETPSPHTALGIKGVGESGTCFAPAAILTGVADALNAPADRLGLAPNEVFRLLRDAGRA